MLNVESNKWHLKFQKARLALKQSQSHIRTETQASNETRPLSSLNPISAKQLKHQNTHPKVNHSIHMR